MRTLKAHCLCALWTLILVCACGKPETDPAIDITTPDTIIVGDRDQTATITFTSNNPWTVSSSEDWCKVSPTSGEAGKKPTTINISLEPNDTFNNRTATVTINAGGIEKTVSIYQKAGPRPAPYVSHKWLTDDQGNYLTGDRGITIGAEGFELGINFVSNLEAKDLLLKVTTGEDWIYQSHNIERLDGDTYRTLIHIDKNPSTNMRMGYVQISNASETEGYSIEIIQEGAGPIPEGAVDLGLGVYWAECNIGASSPEDSGTFFAWGETEPKEFYDWSNYKWANGSKYSITKYNTNSSYGTVDDVKQLLPEDDAASVATGGEWRMPTREEFRQLLTCEWEETYVDTGNGKVFGYTVKSKTNDTSIFLPATGCIIGSEANKSNEYGLYPSSEICTVGSYNVDYCWYLFFQSGGKTIYGDSRARGWAIRPVKDK